MRLLARVVFAWLFVFGLVYTVGLLMFVLHMISGNTGPFYWMIVLRLSVATATGSCAIGVVVELLGLWKREITK